MPRKKAQWVEDFHRQQIEEQEKRRREGAPAGFEYAGTVGVDTGQVWIGDPCRVIREPNAGETPPSWGDYCDELEKAGYGLAPIMGGISVPSGYGDGSYPVYVKRGADGRISEMRVRFIRR